MDQYLKDNYHHDRTYILGTIEIRTLDNEVVSSLQYILVSHEVSAEEFV